MPVLARKSLVFAVTSLLVGSSASALADSDVRVVDCGSGASIQDALGKKSPDRPLTVVITGSCTQNVTISKDDVTLHGEVNSSVNGTINIIGATRVLIRGLTISSPAGAGIFGTDNAAFRVEASRLEQNLTNGITVRNGAQATVRGSSLSHNGHGTNLPDTGRGIEATHNGSIDVQNTTIADNRADGVGVFNGSYARLVQNTITGNGRFATGEAGIQVNRSRVRANGNVITNNTGSAAIIVVNHSDYRTGTGLNPVDFPDNEFAFERIEHAVGPGLLAVDLNNNSYGDLRQVDIVGSIGIGAQSMLHLRGDDIGADVDRRCSTVTLKGGALTVSGRNGLLRIRFTNVANEQPPVVAPPPTVVIQGPNGQVDGSLTCVVPAS